MNEKEVLQKIVKIIKPFVKNEAALAQVSVDTRFIEDLKINSSRLVDIILEMEDEFNLAINDDEAGKIRTVGAAVKTITEKLTVSK